MFCSNCGANHEPNVKFCPNCGNVINNQQSMQQPDYQNNYQQPVNQGFDLNNQIQTNNYHQNMKKYAILSVIIPIVTIIWYIFIGLPAWIAIAIASGGFALAQKGEVTNHKLATAGKILNGMLFGLAIVMFIFIYLGLI